MTATKQELGTSELQPLSVDGGGGMLDRLRSVDLAQGLAPLVIFVVTVGALEWLSQTGRVSQFIFPAPTEVLQGMVYLAGQSFFWEAVQVTVLETVLGFVLGAATGLGLGIAIGLVPLFRKAVYPYVVLFQAVPKVALAPVFIIWFGFGMTSKVVMAAAIAFFPLLVNTITGLSSVNHNARLLFRSYGASRMQIFTRLSAREILPAVMAGLKAAVTFALIGAIVAEFISAQEGMGILLEEFNFALQMDLAFAIIIYLSLVGLALYLAIDWVERRVIFWRGHGID